MSRGFGSNGNRLGKDLEREIKTTPLSRGSVGTVVSQMEHDAETAAMRGLIHSSVSKVMDPSFRPRLSP